MWYASRPMKILRLAAASALALSLTSCSLLGSAGTLLNGMVKALGRTVAENDTSGAGSFGPDAVSQRGSEIAARGAFGGSGTSATGHAADSVASR